MARAPYTINFRFVGNAQSQTAGRQSNVGRARNAKGQFQALQTMFNTIVEDVALNTANRTYETARQSLEQGVQQAVLAEISQMARMIARFVVQPASSFGPSGFVTAADTKASRQALSIWGSASNIRSYDLAQSDAAWGSRSIRYLNWKRNHGFSQDWWKLTGALRTALSNPALYEDLGPVKVSFIRTSTGSDDKIKQTSSGRKGMVSNTYSIGQLNVEAMSRITPEMLPAIMDRLGSGVNDATPHGSSFIPSLFKDKETRDKLLRFGASGYRPVLEPFIAYYLTRAIPNAVFNRTEKLIEDGVASAAQTNRRFN